jgi:aminopeptidase-like protein
VNFSEDILSFDKKKAGNKIISLIERLYPICRSITGDGVRETLSIISDFIPLNISEVSSGLKVNDWEVPLEWNIKDAWIKNSKGEKIIRFSDSNLHVLNYSEPINKKLTLSELKEHLFTLPEHPDWIPYRTSYYERNWGFCMSYNQYLTLEDGEYQVNIDSTIEPGHLTYGEYLLKGETEEEVLISSHVCHPSLCNDNLSGIAVAVSIFNYLKQQKLHYSYRFLFIPATIGSITWLSRNEDKLDKIKHGLVLTLLGDRGKFNYKKSRRGNTEIDQTVENILRNKSHEYNILDFSPYGYDERQFCSPGYNLPVGRISRTPHAQYPEYHTSADNLDFVKEDKLADSLEMLLNVFSVLENNATYLNLKPKGEPQLGKRGLFRGISGQSKMKNYQMALLWVLNLSDGNNSLLDISDKSQLDFNEIKFAADALENVELIKKLN